MQKKLLYSRNNGHASNIRSIGESSASSCNPFKVELSTAVPEYRYLRLDDIKMLFELNSVSGLTVMREKDNVRNFDLQIVTLNETVFPVRSYL